MWMNLALFILIIDYFSERVNNYNPNDKPVVRKVLLFRQHWFEITWRYEPATPKPIVDRKRLRYFHHYTYSAEYYEKVIKLVQNIVSTTKEVMGQWNCPNYHLYFNNVISQSEDAVKAEIWQEDAHFKEFLSSTTTLF